MVMEGDIGGLGPGEFGRTPFAQDRMGETIIRGF